MIKNASTTGDWVIYDNPRGSYAGGSQTAGPPNLGAELHANDSNSEAQNGTLIKTNDTGFVIPTTASYLNAVGKDYIYVAIAESNPIEVIDVDVANNTMTVDGGDYEVGETVTGPELIATANDVEYLDGNTLGVSGVSGTWFPELYAQGAEITASAPSPDSIQYTSANGDPLTTQFTGTDATLTTRTWTWQVSNAVTGPWSDFATRTDTPGQDGATELADRPTLEENKFYQVKVRYDSNNANAVESTFNTFKTGDN